MGRRCTGRQGGTKAQTVVPTQREVLRDVMLAAGKHGAWMTLHELARLTRYGETSISAQLRHLRKAKCGGYELEKRVRLADVIGAEEHFVVWEYRLTPRRATRLRAATSKTRAARR